MIGEPGDLRVAVSAPLRLRGLPDCRGALREALLALAPLPAPAPGEPARVQPRQVWAIDRDFSAWPLDEPAVLETLAAWLRQPGRRLVLAALDYERTASTLPRFARWRRDWAHAIDCWRPGDGLMPDGLRGLVAGDIVWQWLDTQDAQLQAQLGATPRHAFDVAVADFLQRCEPAWPVTPLGL